MDFGLHKIRKSSEGNLEKHSGKKQFTEVKSLFFKYVFEILFLQGMFGKADPYVRATLGSQVTRSQTINNNQVGNFLKLCSPIFENLQNPEWNWESSLMVDSSSPRYILFEVSEGPRKIILENASSGRSLMMTWARTTCWEGHCWIQG